MARDVRELIVVRMIGEDLVVDLMRKIGELDYKAVAEQSFVEEVDGVKIPVASLDSMIQLKQGVRERDWKDLLFLEGKKLYLTGIGEGKKRVPWWRRWFWRWTRK